MPASAMLPMAGRGDVRIARTCARAKSTDSSTIARPRPIARAATTSGSPRNISSSASAAGARMSTVFPTCATHWASDPPS